MKKLIIICLVLMLTVAAPLAQASDNSAPPRQGIDVSTVGVQDIAAPFAVDPTNPPVPEELADTGFAMTFDYEKRDQTVEWVSSLTAEQRSSIDQLLQSNRSAVMENAVAEMAAAKEAGREPNLDLAAMEALLNEMNQWQSTISAGLASILTPEQYALYQESLLPAPEGLITSQPDTMTDCYYAYYYLVQYVYSYAYNFYLYAYYTYVTATDDYALTTFYLAYDTFLHTYYGYQYAYYAYLYYYHSTYAYYTFYYTRHAEGFSYYGQNMAYILYTWTPSNAYSYDAYYNGYYAYYYITNYADDYAYYCYAGLQGKSGGGDVQSPAHLADLPISGGSDPAWIPDLSSLPVPEELSKTGFAMSLDVQKALATEDWVRSLTAEQKEQVKALIDANGGLPYVHSEDLNSETAADVAASLSEWQATISAGLEEILTPEQYEVYESSLLPSPEAWAQESPTDMNDCYYAYYYMYNYAYYWSYQYYLYSYYSYAYYTDPYLYDGYLFGYFSYVMSYYSWVYSYYAYYYYYNSTYAYYSYYFTRHAEGFSLYGYKYAEMTYSWVPYTEPYYAYVYGYYTYYYVDIADPYGYNCYVDVSYIENGDFENGSDGSWAEYSSHGYDLILHENDMPVNAQSGSWAVWLGGGYNEVSYIYQAVSVPSSSPVLYYWYWIASQDYCGYDYGYVMINGSPIAGYQLCSNYNTGQWVQGALNLSSYAGQTVGLYFYASCDGSLNSNWFIDNVSFASGQGSDAPESPPALDAATDRDTFLEGLGR